VEVKKEPAIDSGYFTACLMSAIDSGNFIALDDDDIDDE
jgi:hypothetical protein